MKKSSKKSEEFPDTIIRSSKVSIKQSNTNKQSNLKDFIVEYKRITQFSINELWKNKDKKDYKISNFSSKEITDKITDSWLSKRAIQCSGKQASGIVRGTLQKQKQREYVYDKFIKLKHYKKARKLKRYIDKNKTSKPEIKNIYPELDSRFVKFSINSDTKEFDGWITLTSLGNKLKLILPFKKNKHFNHMLSRGKLKTGIRISEKKVTFMFDVGPEEQKIGKTIGIDIGSNTAISSSTGFQSKKDKHNWDLSKIQDKLSKKKKGSKNFFKVQEHRKNYINWTINQLNFNHIKILKIEKMKNLRKYKRMNKKMSHWTYTDIFSKLKRISEDHGVRVIEVSPVYTSQRCSQCGWVRKRNRKGECFKCTACGFTCNADLNAAINISLNLLAISRKKRLRRENLKGFYWLEILDSNVVEDQESIVPGTQKPNLPIFQ